MIILVSFTVLIVGEDDDIVEEYIDDNLVISEIMYGPERDSTIMLRFIYEWGITTFNCLQVPILKNEMIASRKHVADAPKLESLEHLIKMCDRAKAEPHLYLRFIGD